MKRTGIKRKTPMKRKASAYAKGPKQRKSIRKVNTKRHRKKFGKQADLARKQPCCICGSEYAIVSHHEPKRSLGGMDTDTVPLCVVHHHVRHGLAEFEAHPELFWRKYGVDPEAVKAELQARLEARRAA